MSKNEFVVKVDGLLEGKDGFKAGSGGGQEGLPESKVVEVRALRPLVKWELMKPLLMVLALPGEEIVDDARDGSNLLVHKINFVAGNSSLVDGGEQVGEMLASVAVVGELV